jgi:hypothetical protein
MCWMWFIDTFAYFFLVLRWQYIASYKLGFASKHKLANCGELMIHLNMFWTVYCFSRECCGSAEEEENSDQPVEPNEAEIVPFVPQNVEIQEDVGVNVDADSDADVDADVDADENADVDIDADVDVFEEYEVEIDEDAKFFLPFFRCI